jgi:hypothetical protein
MLFIGALAATLVGCSRQPPPQVATESCPATEGFTCLERTTGPSVKLASFRNESTATVVKSASLRQAESLSDRARHRPRLASKPAKPTTMAAKADPPASRVPLPSGPAKMRLQPTDTVTATDSNATHVKITEPHLTIGRADSNTRSIEAQVAAAIALAERTTVATAAEAPDIRANDRDRSLRNAEKTKSLSANDMDLLVAILMARPDTKSVADLSSKTIAVDDRYSASNGGIRTAIVAAGAPEVQLSEGQTTAFNRLVNGEVPAAVLALVSADAATGFPEIAGFKIFHIPLSPRALKERP